ncbi:MAG: response regulator [Elusimicrobia bacterium]|nr:response regulator [Elusimicrobiota bacterium]
MATRILLVDDEKDLTDLAGTYLRAKGYDAHACNEPSVALELLQKERFDVVFVDMMMFPMDGLTLLRRLRELPDYGQTPVFVLSAKALSNEERKELLELRIRFMQKPFQPRDLIRRLKEEVPSA